MKILLNAQGSQGDIAIARPLARALARAGHKVTVTAPLNFEEHFTGHGFEYRKVGPDVRKTISNQKRSWATARGGAASAVRAIRSSIDYYFETLTPLASDADLYLGTGIDFCGRSIAEHHGIPYRYIPIIIQIIRSRDYPPITFPYQLRSRFINGLAWSLTLFAINELLGLRRAHNRHRADLGLAPVGGVMGYMAGQSIVAVDPELVSVPTDVRAGCKQVGYIHEDDDGELDPELARFIKAGPAPVFVGFGSMPGEDHAVDAVRGLVESGRYRVVVGRGWGGLEPGANSERLFVADFVPYRNLFPQMAAVVHHGGSGTTHCAARAGVPQVIVPHMLDQFFWGARIHRLGLGPRPIRKSRLSGQSLLAAIDEALEGSGCRDRARTTGESIRGRAPLADTVGLIEGLVRE